MDIAVASTGDDDANLSWCLSVLGAALSFRFECTGVMDNISEDIQYQKRPIQLTQDTLGSQAGSTISETHIYVASKSATRRRTHSRSCRSPILAEQPPNLGISLLCRFQGPATWVIFQRPSKPTQMTPDGRTLLPAQLNSHIHVALNARETWRIFLGPFEINNVPSS